MNILAPLGFLGLIRNSHSQYLFFKTELSAESYFQYAYLEIESEIPKEENTDQSFIESDLIAVSNFDYNRLCVYSRAALC